MLIYPPGRFEQKNLPSSPSSTAAPPTPTATNFEADWYQWPPSPPHNGWLVFEPN